MDLESMYNDLIGEEGGLFGGRPSPYRPYGGGQRGNSPFAEDAQFGFETVAEAKKKEQAELEHPEGNSDGSRGSGKQRTFQEAEDSLFFLETPRAKQHKYSDKEMAEIRASCEGTIVHDYGENDIYHQSDEERAANDTLNEVRDRLGTVRVFYRKIDQYIKAMRIVVEAWELLESRKNVIHTKDEFFKMVADGQIFTNAIIMPRMKDLDKYNLDKVIMYISNPDLDPTDLMPEEQKRANAKKRREDDWYDDDGNEVEETESDEERMYRLLDPEEVQWILDHEENPPEMELKPIPDKYVSGYDRRGFSTGKRHKFKKTRQFFVDGLHDLLNYIQSDPANRPGTSEDGWGGGWSGLVTESMFEPGKAEKHYWDNIRYHGSLADDKAAWLYDLQLMAAQFETVMPGQTYLTYGDKQREMFFKRMEDSGMSMLEARRRLGQTLDVQNAEEAAKKQKEDRRVEAALIDRITKLNNKPKFKKLIAQAEKEYSDEFGEDHYAD